MEKLSEIKPPLLRYCIRPNIYFLSMFLLSTTRLKIEQISPKRFQPNVPKWSREAGFVSISRLSSGAIHRSCSTQCIRPLAHSHGSPISNLTVALFGLHQVFLTKVFKIVTKGQLISKGLFGAFNFRKKRTKKFDSTTTSSRIFLFIFWEN